jgi:hypothetical protein
MSTATTVGTSITSVLTVGVGGLVAWAKKNLGSIINDVNNISKTVSTDLQIVQKDIALIQKDLANVQAAAVKPAAKKVAPKSTPTARGSKRIAGK